MVPSAPLAAAPFPARMQQGKITPVDIRPDIAKNTVASGIAQKCTVQLSYATGRAEPISIDLDTYNAEIIRKDCILHMIKGEFNSRLQRFSQRWKRMSWN